MKRAIIILCTILAIPTFARPARAYFDDCELEVYNKDEGDPCVVINDWKVFDKEHQDYYRHHANHSCQLSAIVEHIRERESVCALYRIINASSDDRGNSSARTVPYSLILFQPEGLPNHAVDVDDITESTVTTLGWLETLIVDGDRNIVLAGWKVLWDEDDDAPCLGKPTGKTCSRDANKTKDTFRDERHKKTVTSFYWDAISDPLNWSADHRVSIITPDRTSEEDVYRATLRVAGPDDDALDVAGAGLPAFDLRKGSLSLHEMEITLETGRSLVVVADETENRFHMINTRVHLGDAPFIYRGPLAAIVNTDELTRHATGMQYGLAHTREAATNTIVGTVRETVYDFTDALPEDFDPVHFFNTITRVRFSRTGLRDRPAYRFADTVSEALTCTAIIDGECLLNGDADQRVFRINNQGYVEEAEVHSTETGIAFALGNGESTFLRSGQRILLPKIQNVLPLHCRYAQHTDVTAALCEPGTGAALGVDAIATLKRDTLNNLDLYRLSRNAANGTYLVEALGEATFDNTERFLLDNGRWIVFDPIDAEQHCTFSNTEVTEHGSAPLHCERKPSFAPWDRNATHPLYHFSDEGLTTMELHIEETDAGTMIHWETGTTIADIEQVITSGEAITLHRCPLNTIYDADADACLPPVDYEWSVSGNGAYPSCDGDPVPSRDGTTCVCPNPENEIVVRDERTRCLAPCAADEVRKGWHCVAETAESDPFRTTIPASDDDAATEDESAAETTDLDEEWISSGTDEDWIDTADTRQSESSGNMVSSSGCTLALSGNGDPAGIVILLGIGMLSIACRRLRMKTRRW